MVRDSDTHRSTGASFSPLRDQVPQGLGPQDLAAIREQQERWLEAERAADWQAIAAMCTEDTVWAPPSQPELHGRAALLEWGRQLPRGHGQLNEVVEEIGGAGRNAYIRGFYVIDAKAPDGTRKLISRGTFLRLLRRRSDAWRVRFDIWTEDTIDPVNRVERAD
jgi:ketosteroid isomerase-like protein